MIDHYTLYTVTMKVACRPQAISGLLEEFSATADYENAEVYHITYDELEQSRP